MSSKPKNTKSHAAGRKQKKTSKKTSKKPSHDKVEAETEAKTNNTPTFAPIYHKITLEDTVRLTADELSGHIKDTCMYHLKRKIGNKCTKEGYVDGSSIVMIQRTIGRLNTKFCDGSVNYNIIFSADVCNPKKGDILAATFVDINHAGILAEIKDSPLNIVLPKNLHGPKEQEIYARLDDNESEDHNKTLAIEIVATQIKQNTRCISVIGKLVGILD